MLDFISINMARALPMALIFWLGLFIIQSGIRRLRIQLNIKHPWLFLVYWFLLSTGQFAIYFEDRLAPEIAI
jgi:hypothetical protein